MRYLGVWSCLGLAALGLLIASPWNAPAQALSCAENTHEVITLELESVTEDGVARDDLSAYEPFALRLEGSPYDLEEGFTLFAVEAEQNTWVEVYR